MENTKYHKENVAIDIPGIPPSSSSKLTGRRKNSISVWDNAFIAWIWSIGFGVENCVWDGVGPVAVLEDEEYRSEVVSNEDISWWTVDLSVTYWILLGLLFCISIASSSVGVIDVDADDLDEMISTITDSREFHPFQMQVPIWKIASCERIIFWSNTEANVYIARGAMPILR